jgi:hypothetical protein
MRNGKSKLTADEVVKLMKEIDWEDFDRRVAKRNAQIDANFRKFITKQAFGTR